MLTRKEGNILYSSIPIFRSGKDIIVCYFHGDHVIGINGNLIQYNANKLKCKIGP